MPAPTPTSRLEAFSDGVIAVIITIMVLELKVPRANGLAGLRAILPVLLVYLLSFTFTAIYWINHHLLVDRIKEVDARILYANLYAVSLVVTGTGFLLLRLAIMRRLRLHHQLLPADLSAQRKHLVSLALFSASIPTALFHPLIALGSDAIVTIMWILPGLGTRDSDGNTASDKDHAEIRST